jgi:hypothetical protein
MHYSENTADATHALPNDLSVSQDGPVTLLRLVPSCQAQRARSQHDSRY